MTAMTNDEWISDLIGMTCWNRKSRIMVAFEKCGVSLKAKIRCIPMEVLNKWASVNNGQKYLQKILFEAEDAFTKARNENSFEKILYNEIHKI